MTIYRTRYRDPKERRWLSRWAETRVTAVFWRAEIERRFAPKKLEVAIDRFELNPARVVLRVALRATTNGLDKKFEVEPDRPIPDVISIESHLAGASCPTCTSPHSGDARAGQKVLWQ